MTMTFPHLRTVFDLIRNQQGFTTDDQLADKMGRKGSSIRNWCGDTQAKAGDVSDSAGETIITYVRTVLPLKISRVEVRKLLEAHPIYFHNALSPVGSRAWSKVLAERAALEPMDTELQPPARRGFGFGDHEDYSPAFALEMGPRWRYRFAIAPAASASGEACVFTEQSGRWIASKFADGGLTMLVSGSPWWVPGPKADGAPGYLANNGSLGHFRHVVVAVGGRFPDLFRETLKSAAPLDPMTLDILGDALLQIEPHRLVVAATTLRVTDDPERLAELAEAMA